MDEEEAIDRDESPAALHDITPPRAGAVHYDNGFLSTYRTSIQPVMSALESQMRRAIWNGRPIQVHQLADDFEVVACSY